MKTIWDKFEGCADIVEEKNFAFVRYVVPEWTLAALINGDISALSDQEQDQLDKFEQKAKTAIDGYAFQHWGDCLEKGFCWNNDVDDLGNNCHYLIGVYKKCLLF